MAETESPDIPVCEVAPEEQAQWDLLAEEARRAGQRPEWTVVGWMRNGFGAHTADVVAANPPSHCIVKLRVATSWPLAV